MRHASTTMRPHYPTQKVTVSGTSQAITPSAGIVNARLLLTGTTNTAFFRMNVAADTSSAPIIPGVYYDISFHNGETINVIGTDGTFYVTEMTQ